MKRFRVALGLVITIWCLCSLNAAAQPFLHLRELLITDATAALQIDTDGNHADDLFFDFDKLDTTSGVFSGTLLSPPHPTFSGAFRVINGPEALYGMTITLETKVKLSGSTAATRTAVDTYTGTIRILARAPQLFGAGTVIHKSFVPPRTSGATPFCALSVNRVE